MTLHSVLTKLGRALEDARHAQFVAVRERDEAREALGAMTIERDGAVASFADEVQKHAAARASFRNEKNARQQAEAELAKVKSELRAQVMECEMLTAARGEYEEPDRRRVQLPKPYPGTPRDNWTDGWNGAIAACRKRLAAQGFQVEEEQGAGAPPHKCDRDAGKPTQGNAGTSEVAAPAAPVPTSKGAAVEPPDERDPSGDPGSTAAPASPAWTEEDQEYVDAWRSLTDDQRAHVCAVCVMCEAAFGDDAPENGPEHERAMGAALAAIRTHGSAVMPRVVVTAEDVVASLSSAETIETVARILTARLNERAKKGGG